MLKNNKNLNDTSLRTIYMVWYIMKHYVASQV